MMSADWGSWTRNLKIFEVSPPTGGTSKPKEFIFKNKVRKSRRVLLVARTLIKFIFLCGSRFCKNQLSKRTLTSCYSFNGKVLLVLKLCVCSASVRNWSKVKHQRTRKKCTRVKHTRHRRSADNVRQYAAPTRYNITCCDWPAAGAGLSGMIGSEVIFLFFPAGFFGFPEAFLAARKVCSVRKYCKWKKTVSCI